MADSTDATARPPSDTACSPTSRPAACPRRYEDWAHGVADDPGTIALIDELPLAEAPAEPGLLRRTVPRRSGRTVRPVPGLAARALGGGPRHRAHPRDADERGGPLRPARARARRDRGADRAARGRGIRRAVPLPRPLRLPLLGASASSIPSTGRARWCSTARSGRRPCRCPHRLPEVAWRGGIDLNPLDVRRTDDVAWLDALVWPEHDDRRERLRAAAAIAAVRPTAGSSPGTSTSGRGARRRGAGGRHPRRVPHRGAHVPRRSRGADGSPTSCASCPATGSRSRAGR